MNEVNWKGGDAPEVITSKECETNIEVFVWDAAQVGPKYQLGPRV